MLASLIDYIGCPIVLIILMVAFRELEKRGWWNGTMNAGSLLYAALYVRMIFPYHKLGYVLFFLGFLIAPAVRTWHTGARVGIGLAVTVVWFQFVFWKLLAAAYYFCAGCIP